MFWTTTLLLCAAGSSPAGPAVAPLPVEPVGRRAQEVQGPALPRPEEASWRVHESVVGVVGERAITRLDLLEVIFAPGSPYTVSTSSEFDQAREAEFRRAVRAELRAQAGEQLGIDPRMIDAHVERVVTQSRRDLSAFEFREKLTERGVDPTSNRQEIREEIYRYVWELAVTGEGAGGLGRVTRDRYIRPGQLRAYYETVKQDFRDPPPRVQLQVLTVAFASAGGPEAAARLCTEQREEILAGKDFSLVVEEYGSELRSTGGETGWLDLRSLGDPQLRKFAQRAEPYDLSPVLQYLDPATGQPTASQVIMLLVRDPGGDPPPFSDPRLQEELRRRFENLVTNVRVREAEDRLFSDAYVWTLTAPPERR